jgi:hypothetical protein
MSKRLAKLVTPAACLLSLCLFGCTGDSRTGDRYLEVSPEMQSLFWGAANIAAHMFVK